MDPDIWSALRDDDGEVFAYVNRLPGRFSFAVQQQPNLKWDVYVAERSTKFFCMGKPITIRRGLAFPELGNVVVKEFLGAKLS